MTDRIGTTEIPPHPDACLLTTIYPVEYSLALQRAAAAGDLGMIDRITDGLAAAGFCRPRDSTSRMVLWGVLGNMRGAR